MNILIIIYFSTTYKLNNYYLYMRFLNLVDIIKWNEYKQMGFFVSKRGWYSMFIIYL